MAKLAWTEELPPSHRICRYFNARAWIEVRSFTETHTEYRYRVDGERADRFYWHKNKCTDLNECSLCGMWSTPKKVHERNDVFGWNFDRHDYKTPSKSMLCMGCWNRVRPKVVLSRESEECHLLINKLKRVLENERKNQKHR